jgi:uncharacterized membrane protein YfcA
MPFVNLIVAQAAAAWLAAPNLVSFFMTYTPDGPGQYYFYVIAAVAAVIVCIGAWIGARISPTIPRPTALVLLTAVALALVAAWISAVFIAPSVETSELMSQLYTFLPVAAAILGYFLAAFTRSA